MMYKRSALAYHYAELRNHIKRKKKDDTPINASVADFFTSSSFGLA